jgi:beta-1,4-N-acetylglucosaminyltransferase
MLPSAVPRSGTVLLVCSPGGHLLQMVALEPAWRGLERRWVTLPGPDVDYLLEGEHVSFGYGPAVGNRRPADVLRNIVLAWKLIRHHDPAVIVSTGAGLAVPFFIVGRLLGRRLVYVESLSRVNALSLSGRVIYWLAHEFFVQWPGAVRARARYAGSVL